jgi:hypothetical protein
MLRGVITAINGRPAREVAGDHWVVRGDRGITYAALPGGKDPHHRRQLLARGLRRRAADQLFPGRGGRRNSACSLATA